MAVDEDQDRGEIIQRRGRTLNLSILSLSAPCRGGEAADSWTGFKHALFSNVITSLTPRILLLASEHMVSFLHNQLDLNLNCNINPNWNLLLQNSAGRTEGTRIKMQDIW